MPKIASFGVQTVFKGQCIQTDCTAAEQLEVSTLTMKAVLMHALMYCQCIMERLVQDVDRSRQADR